jgi:hypothetical protein
MEPAGEVKYQTLSQSLPFEQGRKSWQQQTNRPELKELGGR